MCDADTGIITYNRLKGHTAPHPNFNVQHRCRDYDAVLAYAYENQLDVASLEKPRDGSAAEFMDEPPFEPDAEP
ncbi:MAG: hypothetical protein LQ340_006773 [Diploschistes diacapsis]|nr:MAG: hypothetical protein LQ340_006773 [Diploschistes diacapsis]